MITFRQLMYSSPQPNVKSLPNKAGKSKKTKGHGKVQFGTDIKGERIPLNLKNAGKPMTKEIITLLDKARYFDYDVVKDLPSDVVSVIANPLKASVFIPKGRGYDVEEIEDMIERGFPFRRIAKLDQKNHISYHVQTRIPFDQLVEFIKEVIDFQGFVSLIDY